MSRPDRETRLLIPGRNGLHEKDGSQPFWAAVALMQPGTYVRYVGTDRHWHVLEVLEGPRYGRPEVNDVSVVVRHLGTRQVLTLPAWSLDPCPRAFATEDGQPVAHAAE